MPTVTDRSKSNYLRSIGNDPGRHRLLAKQLVDVKQGLEKIRNNPLAYRGKAFTEWHRQASDLYLSIDWLGVPPIIEKKFFQRGFGKSREILNDSQIFTLFRQDVQITLKELDYLMVRLRASSRSDQPQRSRDIAGVLQFVAGKLTARKWVAASLTITALATACWWALKI